MCRDLCVEASPVLCNFNKSPSKVQSVISGVGRHCLIGCRVGHSRFPSGLCAIVAVTSARQRTRNLVQREEFVVTVLSVCDTDTTMGWLTGIGFSVHLSRRFEWRSFPSNEVLPTSRLLGRRLMVLRTIRREVLAMTAPPLRPPFTRSARYLAGSTATRNRKTSPLAKDGRSECLCNCILGTRALDSSSCSSFDCCLSSYMSRATFATCFSVRATLCLLSCCFLVSDVCSFFVPGAGSRASSRFCLFFPWHPCDCKL